jgi:signal transduction histidine kinase
VNHSSASAHADPPAAVQGEAEVRARLTALAELARAAHSAEFCALAWQPGDDDGTVSVPAAPSRWDPAVRAAFDALAREADQNADPAAAAARDRVSEAILSPREVAALAGRDALARDNLLLWAGRFGTREAVVRVALAADRRPAEVKALLQLIGRAALAAVGAEAVGSSRAFWRTRATTALAELAQVHGEAAAATELARDVARAAAAIAALTTADRLEKLGAVLAAAAGCERWILALADEGGRLAVAANSGDVAAPADLAEGGALAQSFARRITIARDRAAATSFPEDRIFQSAWITVPFDGGAIALAARGEISAPARARAEAIAAGLGPIMRGWREGEELARYRRLVQRLALRMFAAIDEERARIARDLHDDQAQLLAAARIALEGGRDEARAVFRTLEAELRRRMRRVRPALLGRVTLTAAIEHEFTRLAAAGIQARLVRKGAVAHISRPVQQLCFQALREGLSNVIRHSGATRAKVVLERRAGLVRLAIADNGRGMSPGVDTAAGMGLAGITERLELMGGRLAIDSQPGATTLIAEIPELA